MSHVNASPPVFPASPRRWLLQFCAARMFFSFIFTTYCAAMPLLRQEWSMTAEQAGLVQSAWHLGYMVSLFAVGFLCDRYGARRTYMLSAVAASASALVFAGLASGFASGLALHGLAGLCSGGSYTPGLTLIAERISPGSRGRAMGFYLAAGSLGYALSILLSSALLPLWGWRTAFWATCAMPALGLGLSALALRGTPNVLHPRTRNEGMGKVIREVLSNRPALLSMLAYTFHCWELLGMWAWLPAYLAAAANLGVADPARSAGAVGFGVMLSGLTYLSSMCGSLLGGGLSDSLGRTRTILVFAVVSLCVSLAFGFLFHWPLGVLFAIAALYNLSAVADSSVYSTALTELVEPRLTGAAYAVRSIMGFGAGVVSPWVFGLVFDLGTRIRPGDDALGWTLGWLSLGLGALPVPVFVLMLRRRPEAARMAGGRR